MTIAQKIIIPNVFVWASVLWAYATYDLPAPEPWPPNTSKWHRFAVYFGLIEDRRDDV